MNESNSTDRPASSYEAAQPLSAAKAPVATGRLPLVGTVLALAVVALGVVGVRDGIVYSGALSGRLWIEHGISYVDARRAEDWFYPVGVLLVLVGLLLVLMALRPRARNEVPLQAKTGVFVKRNSVARLAKAAASNVDGIDTVSVSATKTRVTVEATTLATSNPEARSKIQAAVIRSLSALEKPPTIKVRLKSIGGAS